MGAVGGQLGQTIILLSSIFNTHKDKTEKFFTKQDIQSFLVQFIGNSMKNEKWIIFMNREIERFLKENELQVG
jgi:hypothetical protein